ncbi:MAG: FCD domain-containing protein [Hyphomicrobiales bacterium]|nr:FCD domain-containing protein [Hyphomicrobiales bacterium]MCP4997923.1 FCD domain-containing protein [Hyphomicrobiales bacterium]
MSEQSGSASGHRAADMIVADIEKQIASGVLKGASPLPSERELMEEFGASRTVVREAITALSNRGLIECKPRYRPIVRQVGYETVIDTTSPVIRQLLHEPQGVKNLYDMRVFIERGLVRDAALYASKSDIQELKAALRANEDAISNSDEFYKSDTAFHRVLYCIPGNPVFPATHEGFVSWLAPQWDRMERSPERNQRNYQAHVAIYQAILERDPDAAEAALVSHLKAAWEFVRTTFSLEN